MGKRDSIAGVCLANSQARAGPAMLPPMDRRAAERAIEQFLAALGHPAVGERAETPKLVVEAWADELLAGYAQDPAAIVQEALIANDHDGDELVTVRNLRVVTMCPHHLLPAHGYADVVYRPGPNLVGFGAIAKALDALSRRLSLQEDIGRLLAALLRDELKARGALCRLRLRHGCMTARGAKQHDSEVETLSFSGDFAAGNAAGQAALIALGEGRR